MSAARVMLLSLFGALTIFISTEVTSNWLLRIIIILIVLFVGACLLTVLTDKFSADGCTHQDR